MVKWTEVTHKKQLWRFLMGDSHGENDVTVGDEYIAFLSYHKKWVSSPSGINLSNDRVWLKQWERFRIEEVGAGQWSFKSHQGYYWSAQRFGMFIQVNRSSVKGWERFSLYVNEEEDRLAIKSSHGKYLSAQPGGAMRINRPEIGEWEQFIGWKKGDRCHWTPADKFELVGTFDNRTSDGEGRLEYQRRVGTSVGKKQEFTWGGMVGVGIGGVACVLMGGIVSAIGFAWSKASTETFNEEVTLSASITVPPRTRIWLYQAVAVYGPYTIRPSFFKTEEDRKHDDDDDDDNDSGTDENWV